MALQIRPFYATDFYRLADSDKTSSNFLQPRYESSYFPCHIPNTYYALSESLRNAVGFDNRYDNAYCVGIPLIVSDNEIESLQLSITLKVWGNNNLGAKEHFYIKICKNKYASPIDSNYYYQGAVLSGKRDFGIWDQKTERFTAMSKDVIGAPGSSCVAQQKFATPAMSKGTSKTFNFSFSVDQGTLIESLKPDESYYIYVYDEKLDKYGYHSLYFLTDVSLGEYEEIPSVGNIIIVDPNGGLLFYKDQKLTNSLFAFEYFKGKNRFIYTSTQKDADGVYQLWSFTDCTGEPWKVGYLFEGWDTTIGQVKYIPVLSTAAPPTSAVNSLTGLSNPVGYLNMENGGTAAYSKSPAYLFNSGDDSGVGIITARWTEISYTVNYYWNTEQQPINNLEPDKTLPNKIKYEQTFNLLDKPPQSIVDQMEGYDFVGWHTSQYIWGEEKNGNNWVGARYEPTYEPGESVSRLASTQDAVVNLIAIWEPKKYTLTVKPNGGLMYYDGNQPTTTFIDKNGEYQDYFEIDFGYNQPRYLGLFNEKRKISGETEETPVVYHLNNIVGLPRKIGHTFEGWSVTSDDTATIQKSAPEMVFGHLFNKPARYTTCPTCSGTAKDPNTGGMCSVCYGRGQVRVPCDHCNGTKIDPNKDDGSKCSVCSGTGLKNTYWKKYNLLEAEGFYFDGNVKGNATVEAQWKPHTYTIVFEDTNKNTKLRLDNIDCTYGQKYSLYSEEFIKEKIPLGWEFLGWQASNGTVYQPGRTIFNLTDQDGAVIVLTAMWKSLGAVQVNKDNGWKMAYAYVYHQGRWRYAIPYIYHNNQWHPCGGGGAAVDGPSTDNTTSILGPAIVGYMILGV